MNQIELHKKIDALLLKNPDDVKREEVSVLISANQDAKQYFFTKADERWLDWLWENGFLDIIKKKAEDPTRFGYKTPELNYLVKVSEKEPAKVVDIMLVVTISSETFNPEVVGRFLWICSVLPAEQLTRVVQKIRDEKWIPLMGMFNQWGFGYEDMFRKLADAGDFKSILRLAEAVLTVRTKEEIKGDSRGFSSESPFYFSNLSYTKVFEYLVAVDKKNAAKALELTTKVMTQIVLLGDKVDTREVFPLREIFYLFDVDFFTLEPGDKKHLSYRDDVRELAATIKELVSRLIEENCVEVEDVRAIYEKYIQNLPEDSRLMWRLQLFVLSLCPEAFKDKLKDAFFRLFKVDRYHEIISGAEYEKALREGFSVLSPDDKRAYIRQVMEYFRKKQEEDKEEEDKKWHLQYGSRILSVIPDDQITKEEKQEAEKLGFVINPKYEPGPSIKMGEVGTIVSQAPITFEEFQKMPMPQIIDKLRREWTPKALAEKYKDKTDFHHPINADGIASWMRKDIASRAAEYLTNAELFFDRDSLDPHYTYSFLLGVDEVLRGKQLADFNADELLKMIGAIVTSGQKEKFDHTRREKESFGEWLGGWTAVHNAMTDVVKELVSEDNKFNLDFTDKRDVLFKLISYLLKYPNPESKDEKIETAMIKTKSPDSDEYLVGDPFTMAINTVRGRAFQALTMFIYQDGKKFAKEEKIQLSPDVETLYEEVLKKEETRALMFMFGHYLPSFYFRDKEWVQKLLPQIFPIEQEKKDLYLAAWEGYLTANLYQEMFIAFKDFYNRAIDLNAENYTRRQYFKDLDEALATHLALAFVHFDKFNIDSELFTKFWAKDNIKRHKEFILFIGRHCISRESADLWIKENSVDIEKLKKFWDWALENCSTDALTGFGFWIDKECGILETKWLVQRVRRTLEKTKGYIEWDYGLTGYLPIFAEEAPEDTLEILRAHLLEEIAKHDPPRTWRLQVDTELIGIFKNIYKHPATREGTRTLINDLLPHRNGLFWGLKSVLDEES